MSRTTRSILSLLASAMLWTIVPVAEAGPRPLPEWVRPAVRYLVDQGVIDRESFRPNQPMTRAAFTTVMQEVFGGFYQRDGGEVTVAEVSAALVRALGQGETARLLKRAQSPDGWKPDTAPYSGTEIVAREMGLRYNRLESEDELEMSATEPMRQADIAYSVWKAKTAPATWGADALRGFGFAEYSETRREVVEFALSLVGTPYVWGGEWPGSTPEGYPFGGQAHGGFDCSGFAWYVLKEKSESYRPLGRSYQGWSFNERSSAEMAKAAPVRLGYRKLLPGDVVFFSPDGREAKASSVYHAGIYLGGGWMVHSSGSRAGISLGQIGSGSYWHDQFTWGRRIITR
ncbi:MAG TPA: NlpC/P60 family protein [Actinomycetota bacterium]|nr:NlpC/P60 family protein [Actinomycetota bacterium]